MTNEEIEKNNRFITLLSLGKVMSTVGWVIVIVGGLLTLIGFAGWIGGDPLTKPFGLMSFASGLIMGGLGYLVVANGQVISCFVSTENNTYKTVKLLAKLSEKISKVGSV